ncbi:MAG TPA: Dabb family protein [Bacteroidales bacterium]|nr:Dabb family protein [Bacteroidales bacterium]
MIKHVVSWKIKDEHEGMSKTEVLEKIKSMLLALKGKVDVIRTIEVGINDPLIDASNNDLVLIVTFDNAKDLDTYQKHPEHKLVGAFIGEVRLSRSCVDFEF